MKILTPRPFESELLKNRRRLNNVKLVYVVTVNENVKNASKKVKINVRSIYQAFAKEERKKIRRRPPASLSTGK
jgi:hypothetical protein